MKILNVAESKSQYSQLLNAAHEGESFIISNHGQPIAMIVPFKHGILTHRVGFLNNKNYAVPENFNDFMADDIQAMFEGEGE